MIHFTFFIYCSVIPKDFDLGLAKQKLNVSTGQLTAVLGSLRCGTVSQRGPSSHMLGSFPYNGLPLVFLFKLAGGSLTRISNITLVASIK